MSHRARAFLPQIEIDALIRSSEADPALSVLRDRDLQREQFEAAYLATLCVLQRPSDNRPLAADCAELGL